MDNTPNEEARLDQLAGEAREKMQAGEETQWSDREPHRGEGPHVEGGEYVDPVRQGSGMSGGTNTGSATGQGHASATGSGGASGSGHGVHGRNAPGAFGEEQGLENVRPGDDTRDNAIKDLEEG